VQILVGVVFSSPSQNYLAKHSLGDNNYLVTACSLHGGVQLVLSNPVKTVFGEGGAKQLNLMQMLCLIYVLQESMKMLEFKDKFKKARK
jgi:hypothetical protein